MIDEQSNKTHSKIRYGPHTNAIECPVQDFGSAQNARTVLYRD